MNKMAKKDYYLMKAEDGGKDLYVLDAPMMNETGSPLVYPFGFEPTFYRYRMNIPGKLKMGNNIFVGAMSDIFGSWVPCSCLDDIFSVCMKYPIHNYLFLTKNPKRYTEYGVPVRENMWYGTSITRELEMGRYKALPAGCKTFISMEPLLEDLKPEHYEDLFQQVDWVILGAETGRNKKKIIPAFEWIKKITDEADRHKIPVFMKSSLRPIVGEEGMRMEFPDQLQHSAISPKMEAKMYDVCAECKARLKKSDMITLLARSQRGEQPKQFGFMCKECFKKFCRELGLDIPRLAVLADSITIDPGDTDG